MVPEHRFGKPKFVIVARTGRATRPTSRITMSLLRIKNAPRFSVSIVKSFRRKLFKSNTRLAVLTLVVPLRRPLVRIEIIRRLVFRAFCKGKWKREPGFQDRIQTERHFEMKRSDVFEAHTLRHDFLET